MGFKVYKNNVAVMKHNLERKKKQPAFFFIQIYCCPQTSRKYIFSLNQAEAY